MSETKYEAVVSGLPYWGGHQWNCCAGQKDQRRGTHGAARCLGDKPRGRPCCGGTIQTLRLPQTYRKGTCGPQHSAGQEIRSQFASAFLLLACHQCDLCAGQRTGQRRGSCGRTILSGKKYEASLPQFAKTVWVALCLAHNPRCTGLDRCGCIMTFGKDEKRTISCLCDLTALGETV